MASELVQGVSVFLITEQRVRSVHLASITFVAEYQIYAVSN